MRYFRIFSRLFSAFLFAVVLGLVAPQSYAIEPVLGSWTFVGLNSFQIHSIAVDPKNTNVIYVGTAGNGLFKSTDGGITWNTINNGFPNLSGYFTEIVIDPSNSNIVYTGGVGVGVGNPGIFKSTDGGATWTFANNGITDVGFGGPPPDVHSIIIDPNDTNTLYAAVATNCGSVYKTTNGGTQWTRASGLSCDPAVVLLDPANSNKLYTRTAQGFYASVDSGMTWNNISNFGRDFFGLAIDPFNTANLYANTDQGVYKSTDSGINWSLLNGSLDNVYKGLIIDHDRENTVYAGEDLGIETSAFMTTNGGTTWTEITNNLPNAGVKRLLVPANDSNTLYAATDAGLYVYGIEPINNSLSVPYFSQNDPRWGQAEYDHAQSLGFTNSLFERWGCAVSSVAMVLNYHKITQFLDGKIITPGTLNEWLTSKVDKKNSKNNGYLTGRDESGETYSYLNWPIIGTLTKELKKAGKSPIELEYKYIRSSPTLQTKEVLDKDLNEGINEFGPFPDILHVKNASTAGHFVVAKGIKNNIYEINDPEWKVPELSSFGNTYMQIGRYIPSKTDLSYLVMVVNPNVELLVTDSQGKKSGKHISNGLTETYNEIPNATYGFEPPISNPNSDGVMEQLGTGVNSFMLPQPSSENYTITLSSNTYKKYTLNISSFTEEGDDILNKFEGTIVPNIINSFNLIYDKKSIESSIITPYVALEKLKSDLQELFDQGFIDNKGILNSLIKKVDNAIKSKDKKSSGNILNSFINELNAQRGKHVKEEAYQVLYNEAKLIIENLREE